MSKLKMLWLNENEITVIENLDKLKSLEKLNLHNNQIKKIENLNHLSNL